MRSSPARGPVTTCSGSRSSIACRRRRGSTRRSNTSANRPRRSGLSDIRVESFPGDGRTYFGTLLGNRGWRVKSGALWQISPRARKITSTTDAAVAVADNSESADVTAALIDVGSGTTAAGYEGKDVRGKLVLADGNPGAVHAQAVEQRGAAGIISYNANQQTGWWRDDADLVRWGHLDAQGRANAFAIMISLREAREFQRLLAAGDDGHAARHGGRRQQRSVALRDGDGDHSRHGLPLPARSSSVATSITRSRAPTTTPAAARPSSRSRAR